MVVTFTAAGGLWAVLVTDVVQFVIIMIAVCFVAPLILHRAGGVTGFVTAAPEWFLSTGSRRVDVVDSGRLVHDSVHDDWRRVGVRAAIFVCVVTSRRPKSRVAVWRAVPAYPVLWMLPPMVYRTINPNADPEQAYILACQAVLPAGTLGLMLAAMAAATLSGIDSQLNVFAGVLTNDFYKPYINPSADEAKLVYVGRVMTMALGGVLIGLALLAPRWGGAEAFVVKVSSLYVGPLLLPTIWGLYSRRLSSSAMWVTVTLSMAAGFAVFGLQSWNIAGGRH